MNRLKELREKKSLTLKELSEALKNNGINISADSLAKYERGERKPKYDKLVEIANFYNVSVPYLQGIEPDFLETTSQTKLVISLILNNYYWGYKNNYVIAYETGKEIFNLININEKVWNKDFSHSKYRISRAYSKKIYDYVNKYLELTNKQMHFATETNEIVNYWMKDFSFLAQDQRLIKYINRDLFRYSKKKTVSRAQVLATCDILADRISRSIYKNITDNFSTYLGKYINQKNYKDKFYILENNFSLTLQTANSIQNMRNAVKEYAKALNSVIDNIELDKTNGKFDKYIKREKEREELSQKMDKLLKEFDELYSKNKEFREFANHLEEKYPRKTEIEKISQTSKNNISRRSKPVYLYMYKHQKGENTVKLYELLAKSRILDLFLLDTVFSIN